MSQADQIDLQAEEIVQTVDEHPTKTAGHAKDPPSGASKVQRDLPAAFLMLEKTKKLNNSRSGCLSTFTFYEDRTSEFD